MKKYNELLNEILMDTDLEKWSIRAWDYARERVYPVLVSVDAPELSQEGLVCGDHPEGKVLYRVGTGLMPGTGFLHDVTSSMLEAWDISEAQLDAAAMENLLRDQRTLEMEVSTE